MSSYHGWTHAPKAQGGTDPIPGAPAGAVPACYVKGLSNSTVTTFSTAGYVPLGLTHTIANDDTSVFTPDLTLDYIEIFEPGLFHVFVGASFDMVPGWSGTASVRVAAGTYLAGPGPSSLVGKLPRAYAEAVTAKPGFIGGTDQLTASGLVYYSTIDVAGPNIFQAQAAQDSGSSLSVTSSELIVTRLSAL